jgi:hypothetical protein
VEGRMAEAGTLLALGWPVLRVRLLFLGEGVGVAAAGLFEGFEEGDIVAPGLKANGGGESAEA